MAKNYDSEYSIQKDILAEVGGDTTKCYDSPYEIQLAILEAIQGGAGSAVIDDDNVSTGTTYSSSKIMQELAGAGFDIEIVEELPEEGDLHTIYFLENEDPSTGNIYDEWMFINNQWEMVGTTGVDLSGYATLDDISTFITANDVSQFAEKSYVDGSLNLKADKTELADYATETFVNTSLGNYYTKTEADAKYNPYNTVTARTSNYYLPKWNARGQITGETQIYQSAANINGTSKTLYTTATGALPTIYAPTSAGTAGQYLTSNGSGAPIWQTLEIPSDFNISDADASAGTYSTDIANFYSDTISKNAVQGVQIKITNTHSNYEVSDEPTQVGPSDGGLFAVPENTAATIRFTVYTRAGEQYYFITINSDGTITDSDSTGLITASTVSITGYNIYQNHELESYGWLAVDSGTVYIVSEETTTSYSYYLPSSSRIYSGNVELWLMTTEDGQTWENIHYLITGDSITRDVSTGYFGPDPSILNDISTALANILGNQ